jgi:hypothetical protein
MPRPSPTVAVLTGDIIASSRYAARDRKRLDSVLRAAFQETERRFKGAIHTRMAFRITAGDEFQCVIADVPRAMEILTYVRAVAATGGLQPRLRFRASVGVGEISVGKRASPYEEDGAAFVRSRRGLEGLTRSRGATRWTRLVTGEPGKDMAADAVLSLADHMLEGWTVAQWEAVRWAILGMTRQEIARTLKIAHQNVTKRLLAAGWHHLEPALGFLGHLLREAAGTRATVQGAEAPS